MFKDVLVGEGIVLDFGFCFGMHCSKLNILIQHLWVQFLKSTVSCNNLKSYEPNWSILVTRPIFVLYSFMKDTSMCSVAILATHGISAVVCTSLIQYY